MLLFPGIERCNNLPERRESDMGIEDLCNAECLLLPGHVGSHILKNDEGKYIEWDSLEWSCDCCEPEDHDRCFSYAEITIEEARKRGVPMMKYKS